MNASRPADIARALDRTDAPDQRVELLLAYALALSDQGHAAEARDALIAADDLAARTPLPHRLPDVHHARALLLAREHRLHEAIGAIVNAREIASAFGRHDFACRCDALLALFLSRQDANLAALPIARRALEQAEANQDTQAMYYAAFAIGAACGAAGDDDRALLMFRRAGEHAKQIGDRAAEAAALAQQALREALRVRAAVHAQQLDEVHVRDALAAIDQAILRGARCGKAAAMADMQIARALVISAAGDHVGSLSALSEIVAAGSTGSITLITELAIIARGEIAMAHATNGDGALARRALVDMLAVAEEVGSANCFHEAHDCAARVFALLDAIAAAEVHRAAAAAARAQLDAQRAALGEVITRELGVRLTPDSAATPR